MKTEVLIPTDENIKKAAELLKNGMLVGMPTETVYGLAANAFDENAVKGIFKAKGRPQDNPLIVHISCPEMLSPLVKEISPLAKKLSEKFWGGPLTMIFSKTDIIPSVTSGGLDTVAIRMPSNPVALKLIEECGFPIAAPSANISGKPSPTTAQHVFDDMEGKIPLILDGGKCDVGVESTVICFTEKGVKILRPGGITSEMLSEFCEVEIDKAIYNKIEHGETVLSPGMKYKHYSPKAKVYLVEGSTENFLDFMNKNSGDRIFALTYKECDEPNFISYGDTSAEEANVLFALLRDLDKKNAQVIYVQSPQKNGVGLAVYNRLIRAAEFDIIVL